MLKEGEEILFVHPLPTARAERLDTIKKGCEKVLVDLQSLIEKYENLGTQTKRTWDRMRWGNEDVAEIRARLISNISLLSAFISTSQVSVETKLDKFIEEFRQGKKENTIVSLQTVDSLTADDRAVWRTIRKELEEIGISVAAFDANRNFIFDWFVHAVEAGAFEEQNAHSTGDESQYSDEQACESGDADDSGDNESLKSIHGGQQVGQQQPSKSAHKSKRLPPTPGSNSFDQFSALTYRTQKAERQVPRIAAFLAGMSRPRQRLLKAVAVGDFSKALKILTDEASSHLLNTETLDRALWSATCRGEIQGSYPLLAKLIAEGANVNYVSSDISERTPLWNSVAKGSFDTVLLLVENGVDVNYKGSSRSPIGSDACDFAPRAALKQNAAMLRLLISSGIDINVLYAVHQSHSLLGALWDRLHDPNFESSSDKVTLIYEAAFLGAVSALEALLEHGAEIDVASPRRGTALMAALFNRQAEAAELLLVRGADPNFCLEPFYTILGRPKRWRTPIEAAMVGGEASTMKLLLDKGAVPHESTLELMPFVGPFRKNGRLEGYGEDIYDEDREIMRMLKEAVEQQEPHVAQW